MSLTTKNTQAFELLATKLVETNDRAVATENDVGDLSGLNTAQSTLVDAINAVETAAEMAASIDDAVSSTTSTYSSDKIDTDIGVNTAAVAVNTTAIAQVNTDIGDESTYDPVSSINAILNF